jgi:structural maintenance of chromosome 4
MELRQNRLNAGLVQKSKSESEVKKHTKTIEKSNQEMEYSANEYQTLEQEVAQATDALEDKQEVVEDLRSSLETRKKEMDGLRSLELEIKNSLQQHEKIIKEEESAKTSYISQLKELVLHDLKELCFNPIKREKPAEESDADHDRHQRSPTKKAAQPRMFTPKDYQLIEYSADELESFDKATLKKELASLEEDNQDTRLEMHVLDDFKKRALEYESRRQVLNEAVTARDAAKQLCDDLRRRRLDEFMAGFNEISQKLKEMYQMITMGGNAELELVDSLDPFSEGILFSVMPPKKSWRNISNLSGGEKTLSSLALVFALHHYKPTPLYVMDEIDAALDFRNVSIVGTYIKERTRNGQFIVISLRNNMFELARQLVGIYKVNNMTKSIALENRDYVHGTDMAS